MKHYRIYNWSQYNRSLVNRGSITFWFSEEAISKWLSTAHTEEKGRPQIYSDDAILCALLLRTVYHMPLRALEGFLRSLVDLMRLDIPVPSYAQICRRAAFLDQVLQKLSNKRPCDIVFDSTGLKVYGEGEWKVRQHGASKRRTWRKLHIGMDPDSKEIIVAELTSNSKGSGDGATGKKLIKKVSKSIKRVFGDGAYDGIEFREAVEDLGAEAIIPPPKDAVIHEGTSNPALQKRNNTLWEIAGLGGLSLPTIFLSRIPL
jgi:Transposase DDE domain